MQYVLGGLYASALTTSLLMRWWLKDPPPHGLVARFVTAVLASFVGGAIGVGLGHGGIASNDPMPAHAAIAAVSLGLVIGVATEVLSVGRGSGTSR
jgi:hypothetical protein